MENEETINEVGSGQKVVSISKRGKPKPLIRWGSVENSMPEYGQVCVLKFYYLDWDEDGDPNEDYCFGYYTKHHIWCDIDDCMMTEEQGIKVTEWAPLD